jgi:thymidylate synthase (FAD)
MSTVQMTSTIAVEPIRSLASDQMVADAARVSTLGERAAESDRPIAQLIRRLVADKHGSPLEHTYFCFRVHAPLYVMTEHLRHRAGISYNGESGRYKTFEPVFYTPPPERGLTQTGKAMEYAIQPGTLEDRLRVETALEQSSEEAWKSYAWLIRNGIAREVARQVLPTNLMTSYFVSCNARSLMAFLALRGEGTHALWEIQQVAAGYERAFAEQMPLTHAAFVAAGRIAP